MTKIKYDFNQIKELKNNKNVKNCTSKHIVFIKEFKYKAVELAEKYVSAKEIFKQFGFPEYVINSDIPSNSLARWKKLAKKGIIEEVKGRPKKEKIDFENMTLEQENEYLKTKLLFYEELKKLVDGDYP